MYDFFVIGDIMIDHVVVVSDPDIVRTVDESSHTVTLPFPTKTQLDHPPQIFTGGNAYNASNTIRQLGLNVGLYSIVGKDHYGDSVIADMNAKGINTEMVLQDQESLTNKAIVLNIAKDRVVFSHHYVRKYDLPVIPEAKYVYLTSLGEDDQQILKQVVEEKKKKNFQLIFSPGTRQIEEPFVDIKELLSVTDFLILNKREAIALSRLNTNSSVNLLQGLHRFGPKNVLITRSSRGSIAFDGQNYTKVGALQADGIDSTGAGDTYSATLAAALMMGKDLKTAMEWGAINAANVISAMGATNGLLDLQTLQTKHQQQVGQLQYIESPTTNSDAQPAAEVHQPPQ